MPEEKYFIERFRGGWSRFDELVAYQVTRLRDQHQSPLHESPPTQQRGANTGHAPPPPTGRDAQTPRTRFMAGSDGMNSSGGSCVSSDESYIGDVDIPSVDDQNMSHINNTSRVSQISSSVISQRDVNNNLGSSSADEPSRHGLPEVARNLTPLLDLAVTNHEAFQRLRLAPPSHVAPPSATIKGDVITQTCNTKQTGSSKIETLKDVRKNSTNIKERAMSLERQLQNYTSPALITSLNRRTHKAAGEADSVAKLVDKLRKTSRKSALDPSMRLKAIDLSLKLKGLLSRQKSEWQCVGRLKETVAMAREIKDVLRFVCQLTALLQQDVASTPETDKCVSLEAPAAVPNAPVASPNTTVAALNAPVAAKNTTVAARNAPVVAPNTTAAAPNSPVAAPKKQQDAIVDASDVTCCESDFSQDMAPPGSGEPSPGRPGTGRGDASIALREVQISEHQDDNHHMGTDVDSCQQDFTHIDGNTTNGSGLLSPPIPNGDCLLKAPTPAPRSKSFSQAPPTRRKRKLRVRSAVAHADKNNAHTVDTPTASYISDRGTIYARNIIVETNCNSSSVQAPHTGSSVDPPPRPLLDTPTRTRRSHHSRPESPVGKTRSMQIGDQVERPFKFSPTRTSPRLSPSVVYGQRRKIDDGVKYMDSAGETCSSDYSLYDSRSDYSRCSSEQTGSYIVDQLYRNRSFGTQSRPSRLDSRVSMAVSMKSHRSNNSCRPCPYLDHLTDASYSSRSAASGCYDSEYTESFTTSEESGRQRRGGRRQIRGARRHSCGVGYASASGSSVTSRRHRSHVQNNIGNCRSISWSQSTQQTGSLISSKRNRTASKTRFKTPANSKSQKERSRPNSAKERSSNKSESQTKSKSHDSDYDQQDSEGKPGDENKDQQCKLNIKFNPPAQGLGNKVIKISAISKKNDEDEEEEGDAMEGDECTEADTEGFGSKCRKMFANVFTCPVKSSPVVVCSSPGKKKIRIGCDPPPEEQKRSCSPCKEASKECSESGRGTTFRIKRGPALVTVTKRKPERQQQEKPPTPVREPTPPVREPTPPVREPTPPVREPTPPVREPTPIIEEEQEEEKEVYKEPSESLHSSNEEYEQEQEGKRSSTSIRSESPQSIETEEKKEEYIDEEKEQTLWDFLKEWGPFLLFALLVFYLLYLILCSLLTECVPCASPLSHIVNWFSEVAKRNTKLVHYHPPPV